MKEIEDSIKRENAKLRDVLDNFSKKKVFPPPSQIVVRNPVSP